MPWDALAPYSMSLPEWPKKKFTSGMPLTGLTHVERIGLAGHVARHRHIRVLENRQIVFSKNLIDAF